ncbi:MAG: hypothetical protein AAFX87_10900 [Bacteroidota bacterium]
MRKILTIVLIMVSGSIYAQSANAIFNIGSRQFINEQKEEALNTVNRGLKKYPGNRKLEELKKLLEQQGEQNQDQQKQDKQDQNQDQENQDQQQNQDQQNQDQQNQDQQNQDQQQQDQEGEQQDQQQEKEGKEGEEQKKEEKGQEQQPKEGDDSEPKESDDQLNSTADKLKEMKITLEKARAIMEALKNNEKQYIQEKVRKPSKRKDRTKPDW